MNVALIQYDPVWENRVANRKKIEMLLGPVRKDEYDWVIFPEMTLSGFSMEVAKTTLDKDDLRFFEDIAARTSAFVTYGGVIEKKNVCITLDQRGHQIAAYSKIQLFSPAGENSHYLRGTEFSCFTANDVRVAQNICYDLRFADLFWGQAKTTDVFVVIANWPASRRTHWRTLLQARAIENQAFVVGVNRVGNDPKVAYSGDSMIVAPDGQVVLDCADRQGIFVGTISPEAVEEARRQFPFLRDRKEE